MFMPEDQPNAHLTGMECVRCGHEYPVAPVFTGCPACGAEGRPANLALVYDLTALRRVVSKERFAEGPPTMWRYGDLLPAGENSRVSIDEGFTPLVACPRLGAQLGLKHLFVKDESRNPTWSFKDRFASSAVSMARHFGAEVVVTSSSGNAGAATAAYAARAGLASVVFTLQSFPAVMRVQMQSYGAGVLACQSLKDRWRLVELCVDELGWYPTSGFLYPPAGGNPYGIEGYKTMAFEVVEQLDWDVPDVVVTPVGHGDAFFGMWKGFMELQSLGLISRRPRMFAAEVFGPLRSALDRGLDHVEPVATTDTVALSAGTDTSTYQALKVVRESGGSSRVAPNDDIIPMQRKLATLEGVYAETSSVLPLVAAAMLRSEGVLNEDDRVVAVLTGSGIKDTEVTQRFMPAIPLVDTNLPSVRAALEESYGLVLS